jgi:hypothetical protein
MDQQSGGGGGQPPPAGQGAQAGAAATGEPISTVITATAKEGKDKADQMATQVGDTGSGDTGSGQPPQAQDGGVGSDPQVDMRSPEAPPTPPLPDEEQT